jgi:hypothetical protein
VSKSWDDEKLLAELRLAMAARAAVPLAFVEAGKNAYAWRHIEAELAALTYDSRYDRELSASTRSESESASIRAITFASARFSIEVEISDDAVFGQLIPPQPGTMEITTLAGQTTAGEIDEVGCFSIEPKPDSAFRVRFRTKDQPDVLTDWVTP